jgi:hypothetical protein
MTNVTRPPINTPIIDDKALPPLAWASFFENIFLGDVGATWIPTFQDLTEVGTATKSGVYYRLSQNLFLKSLL